ncbi:ATP-binding protein (plasmid) [Nostoc sp. C057]|uniref:ATP-binding protein n=1 Tax=Nostoc sp. C057 TaxID=2576903 RepID=UPI0015C3F8CE|nr:ATP-binding protein [Nostoc sp. C057]QLE53970.1 ATP-binding protein [Nostoc sp. C057]
MINRKDQRPDFKLAIDQPIYFFGRDELLKKIKEDPFKVRIILGGRRIGKTSFLNAIQWTFLDQKYNNFNQAFPVLIDLQLEQPKSLDNLRYIMVAKLIKAIEEWQGLSRTLTNANEKFRFYLRQLKKGTVALKIPGLDVGLEVANPNGELCLISDDFERIIFKKIESLREKQFNGICFLLDGAEFITRQESWANNACSYFRALKDSERELRNSLGIFLSGYRELKEYQQAVGSPLLNISEVTWLGNLTEIETIALIKQRQQNENIKLQPEIINNIVKLAGGHPYLTQQVLNTIFDILHLGRFTSKEQVVENILEQHDDDFSAWWNESKKVGGCGDIEHAVYQEFLKYRQRDIMSLLESTGLRRREVVKALNILTSTGMIQNVNPGYYKIGALLFEEWVVRQNIMQNQ